MTPQCIEETEVTNEVIINGGSMKYSTRENDLPVPFLIKDEDGQEFTQVWKGMIVDKDMNLEPFGTYQKNIKDNLSVGSSSARACQMLSLQLCQESAEKALPFAAHIDDETLYVTAQDSHIPKMSKTLSSKFWKTDEGTHVGILNKLALHKNDAKDWKRVGLDPGPLIDHPSAEANAKFVWREEARVLTKQGETYKVGDWVKVRVCFTSYQVKKDYPGFCIEMRTLRHCSEPKNIFKQPQFKKTKYKV
jgi:hypothetical protein